MRNGYIETGDSSTNKSFASDMQDIEEEFGFASKGIYYRPDLNKLKVRFGFFDYKTLDTCMVYNDSCHINFSFCLSDRDTEIDQPLKTEYLAFKNEWEEYEKENDISAENFSAKLIDADEYSKARTIKKYTVDGIDYYHLKTNEFYDENNMIWEEQTVVWLQDGRYFSLYYWDSSYKDGYGYDYNGYGFIDDDEFIELCRVEKIDINDPGYTGANDIGETERYIYKTSDDFELFIKYIFAVLLGLAAVAGAIVMFFVLKGKKKLFYF